MTTSTAFWIDSTHPWIEARPIRRSSIDAPPFDLWSAAVSAISFCGATLWLAFLAVCVLDVLRG